MQTVPSPGIRYWEARPPTVERGTRRTTSLATRHPPRDGGEVWGCASPCWQTYIRTARRSRTFNRTAALSTDCRPDNRMSQSRRTSATTGDMIIGRVTERPMLWSWRPAGQDGPHDVRSRIEMPASEIPDRADRSSIVSIDLV